MRQNRSPSLLVQITSFKCTFIHVSQLTRWPLYVSPFLSSTSCANGTRAGRTRRRKWMMSGGACQRESEEKKRAVRSSSTRGGRFARDRPRLARRARRVGTPRRRETRGRGLARQNVGSTYHGVALGRLQQREGQHLARWWFWTAARGRSRVRRANLSATAGVSRREERGLRSRSSGSGLRGRSRTPGLCHRVAERGGVWRRRAAARVCPSNLEFQGRAKKHRRVQFRARSVSHSAARQQRQSGSRGVRPRLGA